MQTRASCASKSSRRRNRTSLVATTGTPTGDGQLQRAGDALLVAGPPGALQLEVDNDRRTAPSQSSSAARASGCRPATRAGQRRLRARPTSAISPSVVSASSQATLDHRAVLPCPSRYAAGDQPREIPVAARRSGTAARGGSAPRARPSSRISASTPISGLMPSSLRRCVELHQREQVALVGERDRGHADARRGVDQALAQHACRRPSSRCRCARRRRRASTRCGRGDGRNEPCMRIAWCSEGIADCTGANVRRCTGDGPSRRSASRCSGVP